MSGCHPLARDLLGVLMLAYALAGLAAESEPAQRPDITLQGVASGKTLKAGFQTPNGRVLPETISIRHSTTRVDFSVQGQSAYLLRVGDKVWLVSELAKLLMPIPDAKRIAIFNYAVERPCRDFGGSCTQAGRREVAGRSTTGWRFRNAGVAGPDGSDSGTLWIDDQYGLLLAYDARDMQGRPMNWRATSVSFSPLPDDRFELPGSLPPADAKTGAATDRR